MKSELTKEALSLLMKTSGVSNAEMCRSLGVGESTFYRWLSGETPIPKIAVIAINAVLGSKNG